MKTKEKVFHIKSYCPRSSVVGMYLPRHSVLQGPWQFPFSILMGLKVPVCEVKFVIRKFCLEVNDFKCQQASPLLLLSPFSSSIVQSEREVVTNPAVRHETDLLKYVFSFVMFVSLPFLWF